MFATKRYPLLQAIDHMPEAIVLELLVLSVQESHHFSNHLVVVLEMHSSCLATLEASTPFNHSFINLGVVPEQCSQILMNILGIASPQMEKMDHCMCLAPTGGAILVSPP